VHNISKKVTMYQAREPYVRKGIRSPGRNIVSWDGIPSSGREHSIGREYCPQGGKAVSREGILLSGRA
jgi:hypothetical protein